MGPGHTPCPGNVRGASGKHKCTYVTLLSSTVGSGVVRDSEKSEVAFLDDFRPRITMGNPIVTEISGFSDVGF